MTRPAAAAAAVALLLAVTAAQAAPPPSPGARTLLVTCPVSARTEVKPLSAKSLQPLSAALPPVADTSFIAWAYAVPPAPDAGACDGGDVVPFAVGDTLAIPGSSGASLSRTPTSINVTLGGATGSVPLPAGATVVSACARPPLHIVTATAPGGGDGDALQLVFNADTACFAANAVEVGSVQGADAAEATDDVSVAKRAGVPLPPGYAPPATPPPPSPLANPCLAPDAGTSPGLAATFYAPLDGGAASSKALAFGGAPVAAARCDCPNHRAPGGVWPGAPALPASLAAGYGANLTGQVLVTRPEAGVVGEGADLFPTASDYHLVCLQHDAAASLTVDGVALYESTSGGSVKGAGFKQYCAPVMLPPGWHNVSIAYSRAGGPSAGPSALRLFVLDAASVNAVTVGGQPSYEIVWAGNGKCCTGGGGGGGGAAPPPCAAPVDCCRFRSAAGACGGGGGAPSPAPGVHVARVPGAPPSKPLHTGNQNMTVGPPPARAPAPAAAGAGCSPYAGPPSLRVDRAVAARAPDGTGTVSFRVTVDAPSVPAGARVAVAGTASVAGGAGAAAGARAAVTCTQIDATTHNCTAPSIPLPDAFDCPSPALAADLAATVTPAPGAPACPPSAPAPAASTAPVCAQAACRLYAVDMGFCGSEGLVTDRASALLLLACTAPVHACGDCFAVTGAGAAAAGARVDSFAALPGANATYQVGVSWGAGYRGALTVDAEGARASGACELTLDTPACGFAGPAAVEPLTFTVKDDVPVKSVAFKVLHGCEGGACSFSV